MHGAIVRGDRGHVKGTSRVHQGYLTCQHERVMTATDHVDRRRRQLHLPRRDLRGEADVDPELAAL